VVDQSNRLLRLWATLLGVPHIGEFAPSSVPIVQPLPEYRFGIKHPSPQSRFLLPTSRRRQIPSSRSPTTGRASCWLVSQVSVSNVPPVSPLCDLGVDYPEMSVLG
jgi:hypothetical protein